MPGFDHTLHYSHHGPVQYPFPYPSENHGRSELSGHSRALSSSPWLDSCLSKDSAECSLLSSHLPPNTLCPSGYISIYLLPVVSSSTLWWPHRIGRHQDSSQILRTVAMFPCLLLSCFFFSPNNLPLPLPVYFASTFEKAPKAPQSHCPGVCIYHFLLAELIQFHIIQAEQMAQSLRR